MIRVESATRRYGLLTAVDEVSFAVDQGEIVGFVGPNGAGKSTMLKMLSTFIHPTAGTISIDGLDVVEHPLAVRRRIGYLSGDTPLYQEMRVDKFLRFIARARGLEGDALQQGLARAVELCGIEDVLTQRIKECSTGFRQRIGLATAMVHNPPVLLLDEPTHGFDPLQVLTFRDTLRELSPDRAILFSTPHHRRCRGHCRPRVDHPPRALARRWPRRTVGRRRRHPRGRPSKRFSLT